MEAIQIVMTLFHKGYDQNKFQLITPSRPGYNETPIASFNEPEQASRLIRSLIDYLGIKSAALVGISAGGPTAIEFASQYPHVVTKLVLISAVTKRWLRPQDELYRREKKIFAPKREKRSWSLFRFFFRIMPKAMTRILFKELSYASVPKFSKEEISEIKEMTFKQSSGDGFVADLDHDISPNTIKKIRCPTLILHSMNDKFSPSKWPSTQRKGSETPN